MKAETREAVLWGVIGGLAFLVLAQGYELLADEPISIAVKGMVALLVGAVATVTTRQLRTQL